MSILALLPTAAAFCGTYVGDGESVLTNRASHIVMARSGSDTILTMFNDYQGDLSNFGLVIPVPAGVDADNVRLADRSLLDKISGYSDPRLVAYTCDDWYGVSDDARASATATGSSGTSSGGGCGGGSARYWDDSGDTAASADTGVVIEDQFDIGEYTAWVVSADGEDGLSAWLATQGFAVDDATGTALGEYIAAGSHFLALRVDLERLDGNNWLSPLQVGYTSDAWSLPLRLGAASSAGVQDLVIYAITGSEAGSVALSNYAELTPPESECLLDLEGTEFGDWYESRFEAASGLPDSPEELTGQQGFAWTTEFAWGSGACDPCTSVGPLTTDEVYQLGFDAHYGYYVTRLHLRYTPDAVTEDPSFYASNRTDNRQLRYVDHTWELEGELPLCEGVASMSEGDSPAACYSSAYWERKERENAEATSVWASTPDGCSGGAALLLLPLLGLARRKGA
jgi:hypothetical protein